ncbi:hypothetical protein [Nostoc sp. TCL26-01]|uniref:hypothetical protein n=1 Tax=Nostoc sp. TCL26-01 TaxID=2576904 RepID=UPI0015BE1C85|nr:hypothetical protein [Nostoc sp. TCL26-01]
MSEESDRTYHYTSCYRIFAPFSLRISMTQAIAYGGTSFIASSTSLNYYPLRKFPR